jgi:autotransporter-associated beta strand protein
MISALGTSGSVLVINKDLLITGGDGAKTLSLQGTNTGDNTFAGAIADATGSTVSVTKGQAGKWILSGTNTYTGATTVSAGILAFISLGNTAVSVSGGTLQGRGATGASATVTGTVTVSNSTSSILRPGTFGNNTMNTGALTFSGTSSRLTIDSTTTTMSKIAVTGNVALGGCGIIFNAGITTNGTYKIITSTGTMSGTLPSIITNSTGKTLTLQQTGNDLEVVVS